ncbi:MAG: EF-hand domain-containing protein [Pseudomonadota bacterium]
MPTPLNTDSIATMWQRLTASEPMDGATIPISRLGEILSVLGHQASEDELRHLLDDPEPGEGIDYPRFLALLASLQGDADSRLRVAFELLDENHDGTLSRDELKRLICRFGLTSEELDMVFAEADENGDGLIDFDEFCRLIPHDHANTGTHYRDTSRPFVSTLRASDESPAPPESRVRAGAPHRRRDYGQGTSLLQMQIGLFRLIQGAAYRSFRESYSLNAMTHLRAKNLPYTMPHFVDFVNRTMALYKALGVVEPACFPVIDAVTDSINAEYARLENRIASWDSIEKTKPMLDAAEAMQRHREQASSVRHKFAAGVELALTLQRKNLSLDDLDNDPLARHELGRLRHLELHEEMAPPPVADGSDPAAYLECWHRVVMETADEEIDGAMMPVAYWYEDFMPKLLAACSVGTAEDVGPATVPDEAELDRLFIEARDGGGFDRYGADVATCFLDCTPEQKLAIRQAWHLTRHYMNGVQKRREREEFGRESGYLSQYVAFIDVYLCRDDIAREQMRVSFPYFIGRSTWRFLHTASEIVCTRPPDEQTELAGLFKGFFRSFATMYACPYCRHHLNAYVVRNAEMEMYPIEYLVLGPKVASISSATDFRVSIEDKLSAIIDGPSLRLFLWKLHNSVSASIERTEPWYKRDDKAVYTTRHWPSVDAELARSKAFGHKTISVERLQRVHLLLKPVARLAALQHELRHYLGRHQPSDVATTVEEARDAITDLEDAIAASRFLEQTYSFDPDIEEDPPHLTPEEEAYGRSGQFVDA